MTDKPMLDSEMITAGAIRQSIDGYVECTCPNDMGICIDCMTKEIENLRRQLAQERARFSTMLAKATEDNNRLRSALEDLAERAEHMCSALRGAGLQIGLRPDQCNWGVLDTTEARVVLSGRDIT